MSAYKFKNVHYSIKKYLRIMLPLIILSSTDQGFNEILSCVLLIFGAIFAEYIKTLLPQSLHQLLPIR